MNAESFKTFPTLCTKREKKQGEDSFRFSMPTAIKNLLKEKKKGCSGFKMFLYRLCVNRLGMYPHLVWRQKPVFGLEFSRFIYRAFVFYIE